MNLIVGAGLAGLTLAHRLSSESSLILEKSKAIGGRMATRRVDEYTFDHGAQFYYANGLGKFHDLWNNAGLSLSWTTRYDEKVSASPNGMTALAKALAGSPALDNRVLREKLVERIERGENGWRAVTEKGEVFAGERLFLTCPLPQALKILHQSAIAYPDEMNGVKYDKALVGLVGFAHNYKLPPALHHVELVSNSIRSVSNQFSKGVSRYPALTIVMQREWSDRNFDLGDDVILEAICVELEKYFRAFDFIAPIRNSSLKKWRYAFPQKHDQKTLSDPFYQAAPGLYLLGDSFGTPDLQGALNSANAVADHVQTMKTKHPNEFLSEVRNT